MKKIKDIKFDYDTLEIIFKKNKVPQVLKLKNGVMLEFDKKTLTAIVLPKFFKSLNIQPQSLKCKDIKLDEKNEEILIVIELSTNKKTINLKIDISEICDQKI